MVQTRVERSVGRPLLLDRALIRTISASVRKGAFLHVAAEAAGVSRRSLLAWLARGRDLEAAAEDGAVLDARNLLYVELLHQVMQAHAEARMRAEGAVLRKFPLAWLRYGPGRDQGPDAPGWTRAVGEVRAEVRSAAEALLAQALEQLGLTGGGGADGGMSVGQECPAWSEGPSASCLPEMVTVPSTVTRGGGGAEGPRGGCETARPEGTGDAEGDGGAR